MTVAKMRIVVHGRLESYYLAVLARDLRLDSDSLEEEVEELVNVFH